MARYQEDMCNPPDSWSCREQLIPPGRAAKLPASSARSA